MKPWKLRSWLILIQRKKLLSIYFLKIAIIYKIAFFTKLLVFCQGGPEFMKSDF